ncbi:hypothetical protein [Actinoplanes philippinensis]|uniref:hypothetical protein n=1 Tax=Actinoplanes philippinensis TaxID=35752 RepID=UPI0033D28E33
MTMPTWEYGQLNILSHVTVPVEQRRRQGLRKRTTVVDAHVWTAQWVTSALAEPVHWEARSHTEVLSWLATLSNDGWELVSADLPSGRYLFRRFHQI